MYKFLVCLWCERCELRPLMVEQLFSSLAGGTVDVRHCHSNQTHLFCFVMLIPGHFNLKTNDVTRYKLNNLKKKK